MALSRLALLTLALLIGSAASPALAKDAVHKRWKGFKPSGTYLLVQEDETVEKAQILHSRRAAAFLILDPNYEGGLLLEPRKSTVSKIDTEDLIKNEDGTTDLKADAKVTALGKFHRRRRVLQIRLDGYEADLVPNPPLLAWKLCDDLQKHSPEYRDDATKFPLNEEAVARLKEFEGIARVNVYFGSWCPTCSRYLGRLMRLEQALNKTDILFKYYGLPKPPAMYRDSEVRAHRIRKLPSAIIYKEGKKLALVASSKWNKPALELAKVLLGDKDE